MANIAISGDVKQLDGTAWANARVELRRVGEAVGEMPVVAVADAAGAFSVTIWTDETAPFEMTARLPEGSTFKIVVDPEEESVDAKTLRASRVATSQIENATPPGVQTVVLQEDAASSDPNTPVPGLTLNLVAGRFYAITGMFAFIPGNDGVGVDFGGGTAVIEGFSGTTLGQGNYAGGGQIGDLTSATMNTSDEAACTIDLVIEVAESGTFIPRFSYMGGFPSSCGVKKYSYLNCVDITPA